MNPNRTRWFYSGFDAFSMFHKEPSLIHFEKSSKMAKNREKMNKPGEIPEQKKRTKQNSDSTFNNTSQNQKLTFSQLVA